MGTDPNAIVCAVLPTGGMMVVRSLAVAGSEMALVTVAWLVTVGRALSATFTVTVIAGYLDPAASALLCVQVLPPGQVHPVPAIDTSVSPEGAVSITVTTFVPVEPAADAFDTV